MGVWMLEDCAQAHGAAWRGKKVGGFGRAAVFSFYPSKNLTVMGDGGAVVTDDDEIAARCRRLRDHGRLSKDLHAEVGFNLRFNDIQASIGRVLLRRLDAMNDAPSRPGRPLPMRPWPGCRWACRASVRAPATSITSTSCARRAGTSWRRSSRRASIQTGIHYPVATHRQPAVERFAGPPLPATEQLVNEILTCRSPPATPRPRSTRWRRR